MPVANNAVVALEDLRLVLQQSGLVPPTFQCLVPDANRFCCLLFQPKAEIVGSPQGVFNRNTAETVSKHRAFHALAMEHDPALLVTPEYSCPWDALETSLAAGIAPSTGMLWVIGCEAISRTELETRKNRAPNNIKWIYEDLDKLDWTGGKAFLDPVCLVFRCHVDQTGESVVVVLVQFKTMPMGGIPYEANLLAKGRTLYLVQNPEENSIKLLCLICSDVLSYTNNEFTKVRNLFVGLSSLFVVHIQLNADPRHALYRAYRTDLLCRQEHRELLCLNSARDVTDFSNVNNPQSWKNDSASALYSRRWHTRQLNDQAMEAAEAKGLYFCYSHELRSMVAFLNFYESCFKMLLTKTNQNLANPEHRIPQLPEVIDAWSWNSQTSSWSIATYPLDSGAQTAIAASGINLADLAPVISTPLRLERITALSIGEITLKDNVRDTEWPNFTSVYSLKLDPAEAIKRISFAQATCQESLQFRKQAYMRLASFLAARSNPGNFPQWMVAFRAHTLSYATEVPYSNLRDPQGRPGTAIYLLTAELAIAEAIRTRLEKHIRSLDTIGGVVCDPLYIVTWIPHPDKQGNITPRVYPIVPIPKQNDDPNVGDNQIDSEVR